MKIFFVFLSIFFSFQIFASILRFQLNEKVVEIYTSKDADQAINLLYQNLDACVVGNLEEFANEVNEGEWESGDFGLSQAHVVDSKHFNIVTFIIWDFGGGQKKVLLEKCF